MIEISKLKFTILQQEILKFLAIKLGISFTERGLAKSLGVSPTAISKALERLEKEHLVKIEKDPETKRLSIVSNTDNPEIFFLKRIENFRRIYASGLFPFLSENFLNATIILFGDYAFGKDALDSEIDIAIIGAKKKQINLKRFEEILGKLIKISFYENLKKIDKSSLNNILTGIVLKGGIAL
jgi:DNA-binding MarR family transcriptional regulator